MGVCWSENKIEHSFINIGKYEILRKVDDIVDVIFEYNNKDINQKSLLECVKIIKICDPHHDTGFMHLYVNHKGECLCAGNIIKNFELKDSDIITYQDYAKLTTEHYSFTQNGKYIITRHYGNTHDMNSNIVIKYTYENVGTREHKDTLEYVQIREIYEYGKLLKTITISNNILHIGKIIQYFKLQINDEIKFIN